MAKLQGNEERMSPYRLAIDLTTQTIDMRAKAFRNLIVAVVFVIFGTLAWAMIARQVQALSGLILLIPLCGLFFFLDSKLLNQWRSQLFASWSKEELDFRNFCDAVSAIPVLPKGTLQSMLASLPADKEIVKEQRMAAATRKAISTVVMFIHLCRSDALAFKVLGIAIAACGLIAAVIWGRWYPLLALAILIPPLPLLQRWIKRRRLNHASKQTIAIQSAHDFNYETYFAYADSLDWTPLTPSEKRRFFAMLDSGVSLSSKSDAKPSSR
jgi:hypothetical protein